MFHFSFRRYGLAGFTRTGHKLFNQEYRDQERERHEGRHRAEEILIACFIFPAAYGTIITDFGFIFVTSYFPLFMCCLILWENAQSVT